MLRTLKAFGRWFCSTDELRIPLKEVVRFKERQWFLEELEVSVRGQARLIAHSKALFVWLSPDISMIERRRGLHSPELW